MNNISMLCEINLFERMPHLSGVTVIISFNMRYFFIPHIVYSLCHVINESFMCG